MTPLQLMAEGALAACELIALLFVPPAVAVTPARLDADAAVEQRIALHRLSTTVDVRLLGTLADARVTLHLRNDGSTAVDLGPRLPAIDDQVDALRIVRTGRIVDLLPTADCGDGNAEPALSEDEAIADVLQLAPGDEALVEAVTSAPLLPGRAGYRVALPLAVEADEPRVTVVDQEDLQFLLVVPHRHAAAATLVVRSVSGESQWLNLGAVDPRTAILIPLANRAHLDDIAEGAVELELVDGGSTYWTTLVARRVDGRDAAQVRLGD